MTETGDFINSLWQAELFYDYECAYCYAPSDCNIVECSLMEKYQLSDYTKQVRKEVCELVRVKADDKYFEMGDDGEIPCGWVISEEKLKQIEQGQPK